MTIENKFYEEVDAERQHQADRFGGGNVDALDQADFIRNGLADWAMYISYHATRWFPGGFEHQKPELDMTKLFQKQMVKVAALAFGAYNAAQREIDMNHEGNGS